jgi:hypothetical protein
MNPPNGPNTKSSKKSILAKSWKNQVKNPLLSKIAGIINTNTPRLQVPMHEFQVPMHEFLDQVKSTGYEDTRLPFFFFLWVATHLE